MHRKYRKTRNGGKDATCKLKESEKEYARTMSINLSDDDYNFHS